MSLLEPFKSLLWSRREEKLARTLSLQALDGFRRVQAVAPDLEGAPLYERIISTHFGVDDAGAHQLIEGARESYADWPVSRDLTFSDVVHYYVAESCLRDQEPEESNWIHGRIGKVVRGIIPQTL